MTLEAVDLRTEFCWLYAEAKTCIRYGDGYQDLLQYAGDVDEEIIKTVYNMAVADIRRGG